MKTYTGTKIVQALPMNRADYNTYRSWQLPANEDGTDDGYLVEYTDGGAPNDSRHAGYISWSPKKQFDDAYLDIGDVSGLQPQQQRVVAEKAALDDKLDKLKTFFSTDKFAGIAREEKARLRVQFSAMADYSNVLEERIEAFFQPA